MKFINKVKFKKETFISIDDASEEIILLDSDEAKSYAKLLAVNKDKHFHKNADYAWNTLFCDIGILKDRSWVRFVDAQYHDAYISILLEYSHDLELKDFLKHKDHIAEQIVFTKAELVAMNSPHISKQDLIANAQKSSDTQRIDKSTRLRMHLKDTRLQLIVIHDPIPKKRYVPIKPPLKKNGKPDFNKILLGHDLDYRPLYWDWKADVHLYTAGTTGSGKSTLINTLIINLLMFCTVKIYLADMKQQEFAPYRYKKGIYALAEGKEQVDDLIESFHTEYVTRMGMFKKVINGKEVQYRNLDEYNEAYPDAPLEPFVLIFDEFADYALEYMKGGKIDEKSLYARLVRDAALIRSVGGHMIMATQRPSADIFIGTFKAQFGAQIGLRVINKLNSEIILSEEGLEKIPNYTFMGNLAGKRVHGVSYFMDEEMLAHYINQLKNRSDKDAYIDLRAGEKSTLASALTDEDKKDIFYEELRTMLSSYEQVYKTKRAVKPKVQLSNTEKELKSELENIYNAIDEFIEQKKASSEDSKTTKKK